MSDPTRAYDPEPPTRTASPVGAAPVDVPECAPAGYELRAIIGEGGMGVVYRAREIAFDRDVAVKILRDCFRPESAVGQRFIEESRITGQLQHPGIPPVHQVGTLPDGRPFLAMKLIKGETLADLLKARTDPAVERGRYLAIFERIAQAVGYAHSHKVIHRDLKPANIMVGNFGEVQVMDWGLAKVLDAGAATVPVVDDRTFATEIRSLRDSAESTQAGSLMGTPSYMPPEQAIGAVGQITQRADVFGLGAILCVILTGKPPYVADSSEATRFMAARGMLGEAFTRLDASRAEPELVDLTKRCLSPDPEKRPGDAGEVAAAVTELRADAERRARQAEMERARAEVRATEERKRRRVKFALLLSLFALFAVAGFAAWGIESIRAERREERLKHEAQAERAEAERMAEQNRRQTELTSRQFATERDVVAALNEALVLREEGWKQSDDPARWALTLSAARSSLRRAESLTQSGESTAALRDRVAAAAVALAHDERNRALLAELDRIEEENDIRFLIPVVISGRTAERYAKAFRTYGVELTALPVADASAWLKEHRYRDRLLVAVRNWERARPLTDLPGAGMIALLLLSTSSAHSAVAGEAAVQAVLTRPTIRDLLKAILKAVTTDPFAREWWDAVERRDGAALEKLIARPEFAQLSSRELSSMSEDLFTAVLDRPTVYRTFLEMAYDRFPGEYWVNFRLAMTGMRPQLTDPDSDETKEHRDSIRYLSAAVAARPTSAMARVALAMNLTELRKDDPKALRLLRHATEVDPGSPWPHLFLAFLAMESGNWKEVSASFRQAVRIDPDIAFFMVYAVRMATAFREELGPKTPSNAEFVKLYDDLIAIQPKHAGGYMLRAGFHQEHHDYRAAIVDYRTAKSLSTPDNPLAAIANMQLNQLEAMARWEEKLPAVLSDKIKPANASEYMELAQYCAGFEKRYALAVRFAKAALAADPKTYALDYNQIAGWAVQAASGMGMDAAGLSAEERARFRRDALAWLRDYLARTDKHILPYIVGQLQHNTDLAPVRTAEALAALPTDERVEWMRLWKQIADLAPRPLAPMPRPAKKG